MRSTRILRLEEFYSSEHRYETVVGLHWHLRDNDVSSPACMATVDRLKDQYSTTLVMPSIVSVTNCNSIEAASGLKRVPRFSQHPISLEWVLPFGPSIFHLGIHNLPEKSAEFWQTRLLAYTNGNAECPLTEILATLHKERGVLVVLNHPFWDFTEIGSDNHQLVLRQFLHLYKPWIHAIEFNAKRPPEENRNALLLAEQYGLPVVSGEDIPLAKRGQVVNITESTSFSEFVAEIRYDKRSCLVILEKQWNSNDQQTMKTQ